MSDLAFGIVSTFTADPPSTFFTPSAPALQILRGLVDALLEHRPERAGIAVCHDRDLDAARVRRGERRGGRAERGQSRCGQAALYEQAAARDLRLLDHLENFVVHR